ncbi:hypothetical protein MCHI_000808 [Candidatus Magnetoovum chiemensis]|nr:hypothetical protein MCHI_000808 [Candidatus Magnetoovum chiemensis]
MRLLAGIPYVPLDSTVCLSYKGLCICHYASRFYTFGLSHHLSRISFEKFQAHLHSTSNRYGISQPPIIERL